MNQKNEPPTIQQKRRRIEIGKEAIGCKAKPSKSKIEERRNENACKLAKEYGVSRQTIYNWRKQKPPINSIPSEIKSRIMDLAELKGIGFQAAYQSLKRGSKWPRRCDPIKTSRAHYACPSTWNVWIMAEYKADAKSFPDWSPIWKAEENKRKARESWKYTPIETRREKNSRKPKNPARRRLLLNKAKREHRKNNPSARIIHSLRSGFSRYKIGKTSHSISKLIGCSHKEFKSHIEVRFKKGMTWQNYGTYWHIDHIIPCARFNHHDPTQVKICWHFTNMQPMKAKDNMSKGKRIDQPQMSLRMEFVA